GGPGAADQRPGDVPGPAAALPRRTGAGPRDRGDEPKSGDGLRLSRLRRGGHGAVPPPAALSAAGRRGPRGDPGARRRFQPLGAADHGVIREVMEITGVWELRE